MFSYSFAQGAELRLLEHQHAEELFALIDRNRAFLRHAQAFDDRYVDIEVHGLLADDWNRVTE